MCRNMKVFILFVISCYVAYSKALECGFSKVNKDDMKQSLSMCVKNNETLEKIWEMASSSSSTSSPSAEQDSESDTESSEDKNAKLTTESSKGGKTSRIKRASKSLMNSDKSSSKTTEKNESDSKKGNSKDVSEEDNANEETTKRSDETSEKCIIQCILENLGLTDDNGLPDHKKFSSGLLKNASGRELRNFLQETSDECFQEMDEENDVDSCEFATKLVICLAEKGKSNCEDWPTGSPIPF